MIIKTEIAFRFEDEMSEFLENFEFLEIGSTNRNKQHQIHISLIEILDHLRQLYRNLISFTEETPQWFLMAVSLMDLFQFENGPNT